MPRPFDIVADARRLMTELCSFISLQHPDLVRCDASLDHRTDPERPATLYLYVQWAGSPLPYLLSWTLEREEKCDELFAKISLDVAEAHDLSALPLVDLDRYSAQIVAALEHLITITNKADQPHLWAIIHKMLPLARQLQGSITESFWEHLPHHASVA